MVGKTDLESVLGESGFDAATKMGGFALDKGPVVYLAPYLFWISIFTSSSFFGAVDKRSVSNTFVPSRSMNTNPLTILLLLLQYLHIQFSDSLNAWVQYQQGGGGRLNRGGRGWKLG